MKKKSLLMMLLAFLFVGTTAWAQGVNWEWKEGTSETSVVDKGIYIIKSVGRDSYLRMNPAPFCNISKDPRSAGNNDDTQESYHWMLEKQVGGGFALKNIDPATSKYLSTTSNGQGYGTDPSDTPVEFSVTYIEELNAFTITKEENGVVKYLSYQSDYHITFTETAPTSDNKNACWTLHKSMPRTTETLKDGAYYLIYNACASGSNYGRFFLYDNGTKVASTSPQMDAKDFNDWDFKYIWQVEKQADTDVYYLKNLATGAYAAVNGNTGNDAGQPLKITNAATRTAAGGGFGGVTYRADGTTSKDGKYPDNDIFVITNTDNNGNYWTSESGHFIVHGSYSPQGHAFYEVSAERMASLYYSNLQELITEAEATLATEAIGYPLSGSVAYTTFSGAIETAKGYTASTATLEAILEAIRTLEAAQNDFVNSAVHEDIRRPEAGKTYMFVNARKSGGYAIYSDNENKNLLWAAQAEKNSYYWTLEAVEDGYKVKNGDGMYLGGKTGDGQNHTGDDWFYMESEANAAITTLEHSKGDQWFIKIGGNYPAHPNGHGSSNSGFVMSYTDTDPASAWKIVPLPSEYKMYTVTTTAPEGREKPTVTRIGTGETAGDGGFFITTGTFSESDFTGGEEGYHVVITVDNDARTIKLDESFNRAEYAADLTAHANSVETVLNKRGVGYPVEGCDAYNDFKEQIRVARAAAENPSTLAGTELDLLKNAENVYLTSTADIQMPENGKAYKIYAEFPNGTRQAMYWTGSKITTSASKEATPFVCRVKDGKFVLAGNEGGYLSWFSDNGGYKKNVGVTDGYEVVDGKAYNDLTITRATVEKQGGSIQDGTTNADFFGRMHIQGVSTDGKLWYLTPRLDGLFIADYSTSKWYDNGWNSNGAQRSSTFTFEEVDYPNTPKLNEATIDNDAMTLGTFSAPFATVIPADVKAFYVESTNGTTATLKRVQGEAIPANTGVILTAETGTARAVMVPATSETVATVSGNMLVASGEGLTSFSGYSNAYVLGAKNGNIAFYKASASGTKLGKNKAYLQLSEGAAPALIMSFGNGEATGIEGVEATPAAQEGAIFDLSGRRVLNPTKGLYIIGGKKVYIK